jgi:hypothetical protein
LHLLDHGAALIEFEPRKCEPGPTFDGLDYQKWVELLSIWRSLALHDRISLLNFARELQRGGESARTIGLGEVFAEADAVVALNQGKHKGAAWRQKTKEEHLSKLHTHLGRHIGGQWEDHQTKRPHLAHALMRLAMYFGLELEERKRR